MTRSDIPPSTEGPVQLPPPAVDQTAQALNMLAAEVRKAREAFERFVEAYEAATSGYSVLNDKN